MAIDLWPDTEGGVRDYLRAVPEVVALVSTRVFFGVADGDFPQVVVSRVGGTEDPSDAPIDQALIQLDIWGKAAGVNAKLACTQLKNVVRGAVTALNHTPATAGGVALMGATVDSDSWLPDETTGQPRYVLTCAVIAKVSS